MAGLVLAGAPQSEPLTRKQAKAHLHVDFTDDDDLIDAYIAAARSRCEAYLKMSLLATSWQYKIDGCFPREIRLPIGPVLDADAVSITYVDDAGASQTLATGEWQISTGETGVIRPAYSKTWPSTRPVMDAVTVAFTAGYDAVSDVPPAIIAAVRLTLADFYENRENTIVAASAAEVPVSARNLLTPFVRHD